MTQSLEISTTQSTQVLYPPSWIDRLIIWIDRIPGSAWLFYTVSVLVFAILINAAFWIDGSMPFGSIDPINTGFALFVVYWVGLYQYLSGVSSHSLEAFRPLLEADGSEIERLKHELMILPRWIGWLSIPIGLGLAAIMDIGDTAPFGDIVPHTVLPYVGDIALTGFMISAFICMAIRSVRQLRLVRRLHARATHINLLKLEPAHAFSALTSRAGIGIILVLVFSIPLDTTPLSSTLDISLAVMTLLLAVAVFVLPIIGIRNHLEEEKQRVLNEINDLLQTTSDRMHNQVRGDNYHAIGDAKDALEALIRERELMEKISTWPWNPSTLHVFASALLLPVILQLVTRLLEEILSL